MKHYSRIAIIAFLIGVSAPFLISIVAIMASFEVGVTIAKIAVPLSSVEGIGDSVIEVGNGIIYALVAVVFAKIFRKVR